MAGTNPQADLVATLGADISGLQAGMQQAVSVTQSGTRQIAQSALAAENSLQQLNRRSVDAGQALTNLGRVAQDAPYGFIGISNNLNPLLESFQRLQVQAQQAGQTLSSVLVSSLTGAGGLGIALSVITAAIGFAQMGFRNWFHTVEEGKASIDEHTKAVESANKSATDEIVKLDSLYAAATNENLSRKERISAVKQLQSEFPAYFANINTEIILAGRAQSAYDNLSKSIISQAVVKAAQDNLAGAIKPYVDFIAEQQKLKAKLDADNRANQAKNPSRVQSFQQSDDQGKSTPGFRYVAPTGATNQVIDKNNIFVQDVSKAGDGAIKTIGTYQKEIEDKIKTARGAISSILEDFGVNALVDPDKSFKKAKVSKLDGFQVLEKEIKDNDLKIQDAAIAGNDALALALQEKNKDLANQLEYLKEQVKLAGQMAGRIDLENPGIANKTDGTINVPTDYAPTDSVLAGLLAWQKLSKAQQDNARIATHNNKVYQETQQVVSELGSAIGNGLTSAFQQVLSGSQSFLSAIGGVLASLIEKLLAAAAAAALVSIALAAFTGGGSILGTAFGSGGNSFSALFSSFSGFKIPGHANGGITNGAHLAMVGEGREREAILPISKLNQFVSSNGGGGNVQVQGKISGTTIRLQQIRQDKRTNRLT